MGEQEHNEMTTEFSSFLDSPCSQKAYNAIMERSYHRLITNDVQLDAGSKVYWDIDAISLDFAQWMSTQHLTLASTSRVRILSSFTLPRLLSTLVPGNLGQNVRFFVETSLALNNGCFQVHYVGHHPTDIQRIRSFIANKVLEDLEKVLSNTAHAKVSLMELKALFVVLFGTIIVFGRAIQGIQSSNVSFLCLESMYLPVDGSGAAQLVNRNICRSAALAASYTRSSHDKNCGQGLSF